MLVCQATASGSELAPPEEADPTEDDEAVATGGLTTPPANLKAAELGTPSPSLDRVAITYKCPTQRPQPTQVVFRVCSATSWHRAGKPNLFII